MKRFHDTSLRVHAEWRTAVWLDIKWRKWWKRTEKRVLDENVGGSHIASWQFLSLSDKSLMLIKGVVEPSTLAFPNVSLRFNKWEGVVCMCSLLKLCDGSDIYDEHYLLPSNCANLLTPLVSILFGHRRTTPKRSKVKDGRKWKIMVKKPSLSLT